MTATNGRLFAKSGYRIGVVVKYQNHIRLLNFTNSAGLALIKDAHPLGVGAELFRKDEILS